MAEETRIDVDLARRLFREIGQIATELKTAADGVVHIRSVVPAPWGTDKYGKKFAEKHDPPAQLVLDSAGTASVNLTELYDSGLTSVAEFEVIDRENARFVESSGNS
ncbi:hypothetical protein [Catenuloplanes atrovinosus]|uniref:Uncharacterized protein n=1 Tax=Catenuloplanes atrovinosus TaxID=137266 RepID=A0AAE4CD91_9ACTN|nr:hypothetical protein [Catenuloplanes atrovinosus]MDR7277290.1 hypothetical protein [Catenuloplanes atrovinosus]